MSCIPNTIADLRRWLHQQIDEVDRLYEHSDPHELVWKRCAEIVHEAGNLAARRGMAEMFEHSQPFGTCADPQEAKGFLSRCLAVLDSRPRILESMPQHLNGEQAADYLGMTMGQLYGQVERRNLIPTGRGPRNCLLFTTERLDDYATN